MSVFEKPRNKYSVFMARAKLESPYLLEWICYHKAVGFDDIVIFSNDCDDGTIELLNELSALGVIQHRICHLSLTETPDREMCERLLSFTQQQGFEWGAFFDIDEFLVLNGTIAVNELLSQYENADCLAVNWRIFGSGGCLNYEQKLVIDRFTKRAPDQYWRNGFVKSIVRLREASAMYPHLFSINKRDKYNHISGSVFNNYFDPKNIRYDIAWINHYVIKSKEEYLLKQHRGNAHFAKEAQENSYDVKFFDENDQNEVEDNTAQKYRDLTMKYMAELQTDKRISSTLEWSAERLTQLIASL
jgi:hypothetical protein